MIDLLAFTASDPRQDLKTAATPQVAAPKKYARELRRGGVYMLAQGDQAVDGFTFDNAAVSLICYADLLQSDSALRSNKSSVAAYLADQYLQQGDAFVAGLRGSFAIVLYDHTNRVLKAWTDHFGIFKLAFASYKGSGAGVASDLRLLLPLFSARPEVDAAAVQQYLLYNCVPSPKTIYRGISRLMPGHQLTSAASLTVKPYWDMTYPERPVRETSEEVWMQRTFDEVRSAVALTSTGIGSPNLGCFLSGGTDSSSVAGLVGDVTGRKPRTFSIGFDQAGYNEIQYARIAARHFNAEQHEYFVTPADIVALVSRVVPAYDEPFGNSSVVPAYYCARLAAENGISHMLAGDGGDELFGGNSRYVDDQVFQRYGRIPRFLRRGFIEPSAALGSALTRLALFEKAVRYIRRSNIPAPDRFFSYAYLYALPEREFFTPEFIESAAGGDDPLTPSRNHFHGVPAKTLLNRWLYLDVKMIVSDNDLRKVTTMCQLAGITPRYPLLDPALAEYTGTIPSTLKVKGDQLRYLFKKSMARILPPEIITKQKHGFGLPYGMWMNEYKPLRELVRDVLGSSRCRQRGYFRADLLETLWQKFESQHRAHYGDMLWVLLMLELWHVDQYDQSRQTPVDFAAAGQRGN
jgi:asparagine synthase (glutamine-hydrolysing)